MMSITHDLNILDRGIDREAHENQTYAGDNQMPTFNGIPISDEVLRQLKMISDTPVSRLTRAEIEEAVLSFEGDAQICEDPNGTTLRDKMRLTWDEEMPQPAHCWAGNHSWTDKVSASASIQEPPKLIAHKPTSEGESTSFTERYLDSIHHLPAIHF